MNDSIKLAGVAVLGAGVGFVVGFKIAEKKLESRFEERLNEETKDMREFYETVRQPYATPEEAVKELIIPKAAADPRVKNERTQYNKVVPAAEREEQTVDIPEAPPVVQNVFDNDDPYIIDQDSFMQNDPGHEQATLTYYVKSDMLCGEADDPIENAELVVGTTFKQNFGTDSSDPNIVHIRNPKLHMDFEVMKSEGSYEEEVLGHVDENTVPPHKRVRINGR